MKAAIVLGAGQTPIFGDFAEPRPKAHESLIRVTAAALSHLTRMRAAGKHYSTSGEFPFIAGIDGVGRLADGRRVYFLLPTAPYGSMAEQTLAPKAQCLPLPDGLDDVTAAAIANPGMSSWAAFRERAKLKAGETVLINGATGSSGRLAVQIAKYFGAAKVIACGRNPDGLEALAALGADVTISLGQNEAELENALAGAFAKGVDVVLDYLWGKSAEQILAAAAKNGPQGRPIRFVQIGSVSGQNITLPSGVLRASAIEMMGSGLGSVSLGGLTRAIDGLFKATVPGGFKVATNPVPLARVSEAWNADISLKRTVFTANDA